jgi:hypothetical protein
MEDFFDDAFDDLPDNALQELENNALQFTQAARKPLPQGVENSRTNHPQGYEGAFEFEDEDLDDTEVTNDILVPVGRQITTKTRPQQSPIANNHQWNPPNRPHDASGLSAIPRYPQTGAQQQNAFQNQPYTAYNQAGAQPSQFVRPPARHVPPPHQPTASQLNLGRQQSQTPATTSGVNHDVLNALQQRVRALEAELHSARGEAAILRSNSNRIREIHDEEVSRLKKQNADKMARQEKLVEAALVSEKNATTELQFLQRDLKEVTSKVRRKDTGTIGGGATTPKKGAKTWGVSDGFDDMDIVASPSKAQGKARSTGPVAIPLEQRTPTKSKRKRPMIESPVMALETHSGDVAMADDDPIAPPQPKPQALQAPSILPFDVSIGFAFPLTTHEI